jgi:hypothetical protein
MAIWTTSTLWLPFPLREISAMFSAIAVLPIVRFEFELVGELEGMFSFRAAGKG